MEERSNDVPQWPHAPCHLQCILHHKPYLGTLEVMAAVLPVQLVRVLVLTHEKSARNLKEERERAELKVMEW
jgi:hypothetical protein